MIVYQEIERSRWKEYDQIPMLVSVSSILRLEKLDGGLGGIRLTEIPVTPYEKDLGVYERIGQLEERFDCTNWGACMAFDGTHPIGGAVVAARTPGVHMLREREDLAVLWDLRVAPEWKRQGIGQSLFRWAVNWARERGLVYLSIESQNNNVPACRFYRKQGAELVQWDECAYWNEKGLEQEVQLIWHLKL